MLDDDDNFTGERGSCRNFGGDYVKFNHFPSIGSRNSDTTLPNKLASIFRVMALHC